MEMTATTTTAAATTTDPDGDGRGTAPPPRPGRGARARILVWVIGLLALSTGLTLLIERQILAGRVDDRIDDSLEQEVEEFRRLVQDGRNPLTGRPFGGDVEAIFDVFLTRNVPAEDEAFHTFLEGSPHRSTEPDAPPEIGAELRALASVAAVERGEFEADTATFRYIAVPVRVRGSKRGVFAVTVRLDEERDEVGDVLRVNAIVALSVLLIASALAFLAAGRVLAPLREVAATARSIGETDLSRRIEVAGDDEIADLGRTFNSMLDRLEIAFSTQREFVSDAGHELRTPITIIRGHLDLLASGAAPAAEVMPVVEDELDRMARLVEDLLLLAKAQRPNFLHLQHVDLDVLTEELFKKASPLVGRELRLEHTGVGRIRADRQRLTQAVMNLLRNAAVHTPPDATISFGSEIRDGIARIWVSDTGYGVREAERERIFARFARGRSARRGVEGSGLGLAIAATIAEAHGGRVDLESREGEGATFTIAIPVGDD